MDKNQLNNDSGRKRKKNRHKNKKWKRTKLPTTRIFQEASFDSSDENETFLIDQSPSKKSFDSISYHSKPVVNLAPSKSESEHFEVSEISETETCDSLVVEDESNVSFVLSEKGFDVSSDEEASYSFTSVIEEFRCDGESSEAEIVSAEIDSVDDVETNTDIDISKKKKLKKKTKRVDEILVEEPVVKKSKVKTENFNGFVETNHLFNKEAQCHYTNDGIVVILDKGETIHFNGLCLLSILHGQVEILGQILTKNSPEVKLYSPRGSSLLYISNVTESDVPVTSYLLTSSISNKIQLTEKCAIILCKKLDDPDILFIEKHISQLILPRQNSNFARVVFQPNEGNWNLLKVNKKWNDVIDAIEKNTKLMICGGKGVGKTTLLRYAINRLLMMFKEVKVIDLDPGQSEFTVPGCISVVRVDKPVFGVNYTHLQKPERSILSNINIGYEPDQYIKNVKHLLDTSLEEIPTLINYMGYTHGIGINILSAVIMCVQPTDILQICSQDPKKNYKFMLKTDVVENNAKLFMLKDGVLNYNLHQIESMCDNNDGWTAEPRQLREMCTLAYIRQMIQSDSIFRSKAPIYRINLDDIKISDLKGESLHPAAVNACLVALCVFENQEDCIFQCLGWGVVRGVDLISNELVLLTSETMDILDKVTHLVSNGVTLPPSVYMTPDEVTGPMPYVIEGVLMSFGQIPKRSRISAKSWN